MKEATMGAATEGQTDKARRALEQVCAGGDFQAAQELYSGEFLDHVNGMDFHGQVGIRKSVGLYLAIFPDLRIDVEDQISEGDRVVSRWTLYGTHRGRKVRLNGITISRFRDRKIAEDWSTSDSLDLLRQLGLRRSLMLGLRYATGRLLHGEKT